VLSRTRSEQDLIRFTGELSVLNNAIGQAGDISTTLKRLAKDHAFIRHFVSPVWNWIDTLQWPYFYPTNGRSNPETTATQVGLTIDTMLVNIQEVLKTAASNVPTEDPTTKDRFLTRGLSQVIKCTQSLNLDDITTRVQQLLTTISTTPHHEASSAVGYILPFLERYLAFADNQLTNHHYWTNALFKLTYVSCCVVRRICNDGFCQPPPEGEGEEGEGIESADGVGMGEGTGKENVSEEIKDESQVEGLQDAGEEGETEREKDGGNKTIEMSQDIGGELEDVEGQDDEEEDDESGDDPGIEEKAEDLDRNDPNAVDEKLWGDEKGKEPHESDDKLEKDHSSQQEQGNPEVVAKENEGKRKEEGDGGDQAETVESDMSEDAPEVDEERPGAQGAPMEDRIDETETLDLPEDLQMGEDGVQKGDDDDDVSDGERDLEEEAVGEDPFPDQEDVSMSEEAAQDNEELETTRTGQPGETDAEDSDPTQKPDLTAPDLHGGTDRDYDGMAEPSTDKEYGQMGEESERTRGGQSGENDEEQMARDA
jgi:midasin